ncbi:putative signal peptide protein [Puccinia sorghi]|uniref:Putative signal peptide protein n=1 Tax=Puccinia sorghi TaxID=27349 RepID=A0A0L6VEH2_9BASI|nr:putative signal peptide protein [Puccinia sorghi]
MFLLLAYLSVFTVTFHLKCILSPLYPLPSLCSFTLSLNFPLLNTQYSTLLNLLKPQISQHPSQPTHPSTIFFFPFNLIFHLSANSCLQFCPTVLPLSLFILSQLNFSVNLFISSSWPISNLSFHSHCSLFLFYLYSMFALVCVIKSSLHNSFTFHKKCLRSFIFGKNVGSRLTRGFYGAWFLKLCETVRSQSIRIKWVLLSFSKLLRYREKLICSTYPDNQERVVSTVTHLGIERSGIWFLLNFFFGESILDYNIFTAQTLKIQKKTQKKIKYPFIIFTIVAFIDYPLCVEAGGLRKAVFKKHCLRFSGIPFNCVPLINQSLKNFYKDLQKSLEQIFDSFFVEFRTANLSSPQFIHQEIDFQTCKSRPQDTHQNLLDFLLLAMKLQTCSDSSGQTQPSFFQLKTAPLQVFFQPHHLKTTFLQPLLMCFNESLFFSLSVSFPFLSLCSPTSESSLSPKRMAAHSGEKIPAAGRVSFLSWQQTQRQKLATIDLVDLKTGMGESSKPLIINSILFQTLPPLKFLVRSDQINPDAVSKLTCVSSLHHVLFPSLVLPQSHYSCLFGPNYFIYFHLFFHLSDSLVCLCGWLSHCINITNCTVRVFGCQAAKLKQVNKKKCKGLVGYKLLSFGRFISPVDAEFHLVDGFFHSKALIHILNGVGYDHFKTTHNSLRINDIIFLMILHRIRKLDLGSTSGCLLSLISTQVTTEFNLTCDVIQTSMLEFTNRLFKKKFSLLALWLRLSVQQSKESSILPGVTMLIKVREFKIEFIYVCPNPLQQGFWKGFRKMKYLCNISNIEFSNPSICDITQKPGNPVLTHRVCGTIASYPLMTSSKGCWCRVFTLIILTILISFARDYKEEKSATIKIITVVKPKKKKRRRRNRISNFICIWDLIVYKKYDESCGSI